MATLSEPPAKSSLLSAAVQKSLAFTSVTGDKEVQRFTKTKPIIQVENTVFFNLALNFFFFFLSKTSSSLRNIQRKHLCDDADFHLVWRAHCEAPPRRRWSKCRAERIHSQRTEPQRKVMSPRGELKALPWRRVALTGWGAAANTAECDRRVFGACARARDFVPHVRFLPTWTEIRPCRCVNGPWLCILVHLVCLIRAPAHVNYTSYLMDTEFSACSLGEHSQRLLLSVPCFSSDCRVCSMCSL